MASAKIKHYFILLAAMFLMIFRVDWWWWGEKMPPVMGGWLSWPEIYHIIIWILGVGLLFYAAMSPGETDDSGKESDNR